MNLLKYKSEDFANFVETNAASTAQIIFDIWFHENVYNHRLTFNQKMFDSFDDLLTPIKAAQIAQNAFDDWFKNLTRTRGTRTGEAVK